MSLQPGSRVGAYEIVGPLGVGGMGEVYQARDTRLNRQVAIKVLPDAVALDSERLARFNREAQVLASLNHPNIAVIHGFEDVDGIHALVMELVDGPTLADRIAQGPMSLDEALPVARQIAEALESAHEQGVIHRDLKPANIKLRTDGTAKVLDFGLAKAIEPATSLSPSSASVSPTITTPAMTRVGVILGTATYMSPEQAKGLPADKRSDVWAFGCVLYEMLTARRAFDGDDVGETLASVLKIEPDWSVLPKSCPAPLVDLIKGCLRKDRKQRIGDVSTVRFLLNATETYTSRVPDEASIAFWRRPAFAWSLAGVAIAVAAGSLALLTNGRRVAAPPGVLHLNLALPADAEFGGLFSAAISPDGKRIAYIPERGGVQQIYVRSLDSMEVKALAGTEGASHLTFSPDGQSLAFAADGKVKRVPVTGGLPIALAEAPSIANYVAWGPDDTIAFRSTGLGIMGVPGGGGEARVLVGRAPGAGGGLGNYPDFLPDGKTLLVTSTTAETVLADQRVIEAVTLATGARKTVVRGGSFGRYLPSGHVVFLRAGTLMAVPFDAKNLEVKGPAVPVIEGVRESVIGYGAFSCSRDGTCVYVPGGIDGSKRSVVMVDRAGTVQPIALSSQSYGQPRFSPQGDKLVFWLERSRCDVLVFDLARGSSTLLNLASDSHFPLWIADGKRIAYIANRSTGYNLFAKAADGSGSEEQLAALGVGPIAPFAWSGRDNLIAYADGGDIWLQQLSSDQKPRRFIESRYQETTPAFSPDGRWLAYVSDESGRSEVYVQSFPGPGGKYSISINGGSEPVWAKSGRELFFRDGDRMMVTEISTEPSFTASKPRILFVGAFFRSNSRINYDVSPDGNRFVMTKDGDQAAEGQINVIVNWFDELKRLTAVH